MTQCEKGTTVWSTNKHILHFVSSIKVNPHIENKSVYHLRHILTIKSIYIRHKPSPKLALDPYLLHVEANNSAGLACSRFASQSLAKSRTVA